MAKEITAPTQGIREKHLNIVYFIDSAKSHSIRINLALARWIVAISVGVILWGLISIGWILSLGLTLEQTREHLGSALASLFKYQVKYEHVFEQAYPDDKTQGYYAPGSQLTSNNPTSAAEAKAKTPEAAPAQVAQAQVAAKDAPSDKSLAAQPAPAVAATDAIAELAKPASSAANAAAPAGAGANSLAIEIANSTLTAENGKMVFVFDITNKDQNKKAEGYIWATATVAAADGTKKRIVAPAHSKLNSEGNVDAYTTTYKFSIQRFKRKDFAFNVPKDTNWKITDLKLNFVDAVGKQKKTESIDVPVKFKQSSESEASPEDAASSDSSGENSP